MIPFPKYSCDLKKPIESTNLEFGDWLDCGIVQIKGNLQTHRVFWVSINILEESNNHGICLRALLINN